MIQEFVARFMAADAQKRLRDGFTAGHPADYIDVVRAVVEVVSDPDEYASPDVDRIHAISDGDYQGTLVFVVAAKGYQPSDYWYVLVSYGSCSGCDTLQALRNYRDDPPDADQVEGYMTLALHVVQGLKKMGDE